MSLRRDKIMCDLCKKEIYLTWSKLGIPYFFHKNNTQCNNIFPHTPEMIIMVKNLLYSHLEKGGGIVIRSFCDTCCDRADTNISDRKDIYVKDYTFIDNKGNECTFDIAYLDEKNTFKQGYFLWTQDRQDPDTNLIWFKLNPNNVLAALDKYCNLAVINNYLNIATCNKVYCIPMSSMAILLGYYLNDCWNIFGISVKGTVDKKIWKAFLLREKCIKCEKSCHTLFKQPFCQSCLEEVRTK